MPVSTFHRSGPQAHAITSSLVDTVQPDTGILLEIFMMDRPSSQCYGQTTRISWTPIWATTVGLLHACRMRQWAHWHRILHLTDNELPSNFLVSKLPVIHVS